MIEKFKLPEHDPTQSSAVGFNSEDFKLLPQNPMTYLDTMEDSSGRVLIGGEKFSSGPDQMLLSRMLKGLIPISDIICVKNDKGKSVFYSYKLPLENIPTKNPNMAEEATVDAFILRLVFHDGDHHVYHMYNTGNAQTHNDNYAFFDVEHFKNFWKERKEENIDFIREKIAKMGAYQRGFLKQRLTSLLERFNGDEGLSFLEAINESINKLDVAAPDAIQEAPGNEKVKAFQEELVKRIHVLIEESS